MKARQFYVERMSNRPFDFREKWNLLSPYVMVGMGILFLVLVVGIVR